MIRKLTYFILFVLLGLFGCTAKKYLAENEYFYSEKEVNIDFEGSPDDKKELKNELQKMPFPETQNDFLGMRPFVVLFYMIEEPDKNKGFKYWLKYKMGNPPVLFEEDIPEQNVMSFSNFLYNRGFFLRKRTNTF